MFNIGGDSVFIVGEFRIGGDCMFGLAQLGCLAPSNGALRGLKPTGREFMGNGVTPGAPRGWTGPKFLILDGRTGIACAS